MSKAVVVISGGMDSTTLLHRIIKDYEDYEVHGISFNYGQRHSKELEYAARSCESLDVPHKIVDMDFIPELFSASGSSLVTQNDVPEGHYAEANMKATVVPNRNMIMMSIAAGYAVSIEARVLATGVHAGDHFIYPDCRPEFFDLLDRAIYSGNNGFISPSFELKRPYIFKSKADIAYDGIRLGVDFSQTWSCYKGGNIHCGKCGTCVERIEAIHEAVDRMHVGAGAKDLVDYTEYDKTEYEDDSFWKEALKRETV